MEKKVKEKYKEAGRIASNIRKKAIKRLEPGLSILELVEDLETGIKEKADIAFPINVAINDVAAHSTARGGDKREIKEGQVVKIDVGVHVDGYIADTAATKEIGSNEHDKLIEASRVALEKVIKTIKQGERRLDKIGGIIQNKITKRDFSPIMNLTGHQLKQHELHAGLNIPNFESMAGKKLENGMVVAIEPFATNGDGYVKKGKRSPIYVFKKEKPVRLGREILKWAKERGSLPFSRRWLFKKYSKAKVKLSLKKLEKTNAIKNFPVLREKREGLVSQSEHTLIIKDEPLITTK